MSIVKKWNRSNNTITLKHNKNAINYYDRIIDGDLYLGRKQPSEIIMIPLADPEALKSHTLGYVGIDEGSGVPEESFLMLAGRLREPSMHYSEYRFKIVTNPTGNWIKNMFIKLPKTPQEVNCKLIPDPYNISEDKHCSACSTPCMEGKGRVFIPSFIKDNKYLPRNYEATLRSLYPSEYAEMLLSGNWDAVAGQVFPEFSTLKVIEPFQIPMDWTRFMCIDPHSRTPTHVLWVAVAPSGLIYVYRELVMADLVSNICKVIKSREHGEHILYRLIDTSANTEDHLTGLCITDEFSKNGVICNGCKKGNMIGYNRIKEAMKNNRIQVFNTCPIFMDQMKSLTWETYGSKLTLLRKEAPQTWNKTNDHLFDCFKYIMILDPKYVLPAEWQYKINEFNRQLDEIRISKHID